MGVFKALGVFQFLPIYAYYMKHMRKFLIAQEMAHENLTQSQEFLCNRAQALFINNMMVLKERLEW